MPDSRLALGWRHSPIPPPRVRGPLYSRRVVSGIPLPGPCTLCGSLQGVGLDGSPHCADCGWRYGDAPDHDIPIPRLEVVYYLRYDSRVKIGTSGRPRERLSRIRHHELLAFERGGRSLEQQRHREFAALREGGEWFTLSDALLAHTTALRAHGAPWVLYARWLSQALSPPLPESDASRPRGR